MICGNLGQCHWPYKQSCEREIVLWRIFGREPLPLIEFHDRGTEYPPAQAVLLLALEGSIVSIGMDVAEEHTVEI